MAKPKEPNELEPWLRDVLAREHWFGNDGVSWTKAETSEGAEKERRRRVRLLNKGQSRRTTEVAERLANCQPKSRCGSGACPACTRAVQRWLVSEASRLFAEHYQQELLVASIVPPKAIVKEGKLK